MHSVQAPYSARSYNYIMSQQKHWNDWNKSWVECRQKSNCFDECEIIWSEFQVHIVHHRFRVPPKPVEDLMGPMLLESSISLELPCPRYTDDLDVVVRRSLPRPPVPNPQGLDVNGDWSKSYDLCCSCRWLPNNLIAAVPAARPRNRLIQIFSIQYQKDEEQGHYSGLTGPEPRPPWLIFSGRWFWTRCITGRIRWRRVIQSTASPKPWPACPTAAAATTTTRSTP